MATASSSANKRPTPTQLLMESQGQIAEAKARDAASAVHLKYARWGGGAACVILIVFLLIAFFKPATVVRDDISETRVEAIADKVLAKLPKVQPGLTQEQIKHLFAEALKGAEGKLVTIGTQFAGLDEHIRKLGAVDGKLDALTSEQQVLKTMLEGVSAKLPLYKSGEQKQEPAPTVANQPPMQLDPNALAPNNTAAPQQPAPEVKKYSARDLEMACEGIKIQFPTSFDKMTQEQLAAAFEQCETARQNPNKAANTTPPSTTEIETLKGLANRFGHSRRNQ